MLNSTEFPTEIPFSSSVQLKFTHGPFSLNLVQNGQPTPLFQWQAVRARKSGKWLDLSVQSVKSTPDGWEVQFQSAPENCFELFLSITVQDNLLLANLGTDDLSIEALAIDFTSSPDEHYLGFGERFNRIDQRGQEIDLYVVNGASGGLTYKPIPFYMSSAGYAVRLLTSYRSKVRLACYDDPSVVSIRTEANQLSFQLWTGQPFAELLTRYTQLLDKPLYQPPAWIFGPWKSRDWTAETQSTVEEDFKLQRQLNLPCTVKLIDAAWEAQLNDFEFNSNFPDPEGMIAEARKLGYRIVIWVSPWIVKSAANQAIYDFCAEQGFLIKDQTGQPYLHRLSNSPGFMGTCLDFTNPITVSWWQSQIEKLVQMGFDGFKTDFGEQVPDGAIFHNGKTGREMHNRYPQLYNQVTYEAMRRHTHGILLARSAWDGSQPYCALFAGDQSSDFGPATGLPSVIRSAQNAGLSGFPFYTSDIGGYFGQPTEEVFARWIAFAAFLPIMQLHGLGCREPWKFSTEILNLYRDYASFHMDLFPYLYTYAMQASRTGIPIVRAMAFAYPQDPNIWDAMNEQQYCFGRELLVSPVYFGHSDKWTVYLPFGGWRDFWTGEPHFGGQEITVNIGLEDIPVFARAGSIIPMLDSSPHTLLPVMDEPEIKVAGKDLRLQVYPGADGQFQLHDGSQFTWDESSATVRIDSQPVDRWVSIRMMDIGYQFVEAVDANAEIQEINTTDLNGSDGHIRLYTHIDQSYQVIFK